MIVRREVCQPGGYSVVQSQPQQIPGRQLVREVIRQVPQTSVMAPQPALVCVPQQQQQITQVPTTNAVQQLVPVYSTRQVCHLKRYSHLIGAENETKNDRSLLRSL